jgi:hypothetical protein
LLKYVADAKKYMRTFDDFLKSDAPESLKVWAIMRRDALRSSADGNGVVVGAAIEEGEEVTCV